jgi:hypothetical protein
LYRLSALRAQADLLQKEKDKELARLSNELARQSLERERALGKEKKDRQVCY